jgi:hypothetical protein
MVWLKKKDGSGWTSNRTRDVIDYAFTVSKTTPCIVEIRKSWRKNGRANNTIGKMTFETPEIAKATIEYLVNKVRECFSDEYEARKWFLETMLAKCVDDGNNTVRILSSNGINSTFISKSSYDPPPLPAITPSVANVSPSLPTTPTKDDVNNMINIIAQASSMTDEADKEHDVVEPVIVQQIKTIVINGKEIQIGWPQ